MQILSVRGRRWMFGIAILLFSLATTAALLIWGTRYFYARELSVRLHPTGAGVCTTSGNPSGLRVLFLGDSRAAYWPPLPADRFLTLNAGVPGETTAQILLRTESALAHARPSVVVIQAGINDLKAIGVLPESAAEIQGQCLTNLTEIVKLCRQHEARVVLVLILPSGRVNLARRFVWSEKINLAVRDVNSTLSHQFAHTDGVALFDPESTLNSAASDKSNRDDYQDTLHLRPEAYQKLQVALLPLLTR